MATPRNGFGHLHLTRLTLLETNKGTPVPISTDYLLAGLHALELLVRGVIGVAGPGADVPAAQPELTGQAAASFRHFLEVRSFGHQSVGIRVVLAAQTERGAYLIVLSKGMDNLAPQGHLGQHLHVSDAVHPLLGPG